MLCAASDGARIVTGGDDGKVVALDAKGEVTVLATDAKRRWIDNVALHPDGAVAWSAGKTAFIRSGKGEEKSFDAPSTVGGLAFAPKGLRVAVAHYNGVTLWFPNMAAKPEFLEWAGSHLAVTFSPDNKFLVTAMHEPALHGWRLADNRHMRMSGYPGRVRSMSWSAGGKGLATSGADTVIIWPFASKDGPMGKEPAMLAPLQARVSAVACHPKQDIMAAGYSDGTVLMVRLEDGAEILVRRERQRAGLGAGLERQGHAAGLRHRGRRRAECWSFNQSVAIQPLCGVMRFLTTFQLHDFIDTLVSLTAAFVLGTLIGAERQYRQRTAGLRTNVLVAVGAAAFVDLAMHLTGADGAVRVIAYVVSGIGFLGAGVIMKQGMDVRGLNTAATLWASAAVGSCAGADMVAQAVVLTVFVIAGNTLLRPLVNAINRIPLNEQASEATYYFKLAVTPDALPDMRDRLVEKLEAANYPVADVEWSNSATISWRSSQRWSRPRSIQELNAVAPDLQHLPGVRHATWEVNTAD